MYRRDQGGGYLTDMGSHDIDFLCALFGEDGTTLDVDADDTSVLLMRFANGMVASVLTSAVAFRPNFRSFEVFGSDGSVSEVAGLPSTRDKAVETLSTIIPGADQRRRVLKAPLRLPWFRLTARPGTASSRPFLRS